MKNKYNTLSKYIFEYSENEFRKETIEGLFRAILEPIVSNQKIESCVLIRVNDVSSFDSILKRLKFSTSNLLSMLIPPFACVQSSTARKTVQPNS